MKPLLQFNVHTHYYKSFFVPCSNYSLLLLPHISLSQETIDLLSDIII